MKTMTQFYQPSFIDYIQLDEARYLDSFSQDKIDIFNSNTMHIVQKY